MARKRTDPSVFADAEMVRDDTSPPFLTPEQHAAIDEVFAPDAPEDES